METILIVDDELSLSQILKEELTEVGYTVFTVDSAQKAIDYVHENRIDLMLLDLNMPEKDGYYVLESLEKYGIVLKVIVLTAYADLSSAIRSAKLGASDFITKPYDLDELLVSIRKVLYM
jgi:DNA-binding response OmpR family regulator